MVSEGIIKDKYKQPFNVNELIKLSFGELDGEVDTKLKESFFPTFTIQKFLSNNYNYVLSPKGAGKSALFRSISKKFISEDYMDFSKYSIISINEAFGFNNEYLSPEKFKSNEKNDYIFSWGLYILTKLIKDIITNYSDLIEYNDFKNKISKVEILKDEFNLYDLSDFLKKIETSISFNVNGQNIEVKPNFKINNNKEKLSLNKLYITVNEFYKSINKKAIVLIDKLDAFILKEKYQLQKNYVQGLVDCIEEIHQFDFINPILFLRTDLFYTFEINVEYDKVKGRTINLIWEEGEILNFIIYRFLSNPYISNNFRSHFDYIVDEGYKGKYKSYKKQNLSIWKKMKFGDKTVKKEKIDLKKTLNYTVSERILNMFFPDNIELFEHKHQFSKLIFDFLKDANGFVNPRLLIYFFNILFEQQYKITRLIHPEKDKNIYPVNNNDEIYYEIFNDEVFEEVYTKIRNDELKNIFKIIRNEEFQEIFKIINLKTYDNETFKYGNVNYKKLNVEKSTYDALIKYLKLLGFMKEINKQEYYIPILYRQKLDLYK